MLRRWSVGMSALVVAAVGCSDVAQVPSAPSLAKAPSGPVVTAADPSGSPRDVTLDVRVLGSGFDQGSVVDFLLAGTTTPKVHTNATRWVSSGELVANVTIAPDAVPGDMDVAVTTSIGKKGIGTAKFLVSSAIVVPLPGTAGDINTGGTVVGSYSNGMATPCDGRAYTWTQASGTVTLPLPPGYCNTTGRFITDGGLVAGYASNSNAPAAVARWTPTGPGTWSVEALPSPGPNLQLMTIGGVNAAGSIAAMFRDPSLVSRAWVWQDGIGWTQLIPLPSAGTVCSPFGPNDRGEVVGSCGGAAYWSSATAVSVPLPTTGFASGTARAINNSGVVVGAVNAGGPRGFDALARWRPDGNGGWIRDDFGVAARAAWINDDGMILANDANAFLVTPGGVVTYLDPLAKNQTSRGQGLGNRGPDGIVWVLGSSSTSSGQGWAVLWKR